MTGFLFALEIYSFSELFAAFWAILQKGIKGQRAGFLSLKFGETYFISSERFYDWQEIGEITAPIIGKSPLRLKIPEWGVYIIGTFAEFFSKFSSKPALLNLEKVQDIIQDAWTCDITKAKTELGYRESIDLQTGIRETVKWYRDQGWLK